MLNAAVNCNQHYSDDHYDLIAPSLSLYFADFEDADDVILYIVRLFVRLIKKNLLRSGVRMEFDRRHSELFDCARTKFRCCISDAIRLVLLFQR